MSVRKSVAVGAVLTLIATLITLFAQSATAATPSWEPDPNANGTISFYNTAGAKVTSGTNLSHLFDYALASSAEDPNGFHKANLQLAYPDHTKTNTIDWFTNGASPATTYPNASAPAPLKTATNPMVTVAATEMNLTAAKGGAILDGTAGFANIVQIRLTQSSGTNYWASDIAFDGAAGTWTQVFPTPAAGPTTTTTTLSATPASPQPAGTSTTFTATISPSNAVGVVQFKDGATNIGSPVAVAAGSAKLAGIALGVGTHSLTAVFTPTDSNAFTASTSTPALTYTVTSVATPTSTALEISPNSPITTGTQSTLKATVTPSGAPGSVQFKDGATNIGSAVAVSAGVAQTTTTFNVNTHQVTAVFTPANPADFTASTSTALSYTVNAAPATLTTTAVGIMPGGPQTFGATLTFTGAVTPSNAVGQVQFLDGTTVLTSASVAGGVATKSYSALSAGNHSISAKFVPANPADFGTSTSTAVAYTIDKAATTTSLLVTPPGPQVQGSTVTLTADVSPSNLTGTVQFKDGANNLGAPVNVVAGEAVSTNNALTVGSHSLTAVFAPNSSDYNGSTSAGSAYTITKPPPASTSTSLAVSPGGPVGPNTVETLTATIVPAGAVGSVQFIDGDSNLGSPVNVNGGIAQTTTTFAVGSHSLKAVFTPTDDTNFTGSQSGAQAYTVKPPATATSTALDVAPTSPIDFGNTVTLTATVTPSTAEGTVTFKDGTTTLGTQPVSAGSAQLKTVGLNGGSHSLTASFTPTVTLDYTPSNSPAVSLTVNAVHTSTSLATSAGPVGQGTDVTLTATVTPSDAAGSVLFKNGEVTLGSADVTNGRATLHTSVLPIGTATLTATFTPANAANFHASTSEPATLDVAAAPVVESVTSGGITLHDGDTLRPGQSLTISASGFQHDESVQVDVHSVVTKLATVHADSTGHVTVSVMLPTTLTAEAHVLTLTGALGIATFHFSIEGSPGGSPSGTPSGSGGLANTGVDVAAGLLLGCALAAAGGLVLLLGVRRRRGLHRMG